MQQQITLTDSRGNVFATVATFSDADVAAKAVFKRKHYSNLHYHIVGPEYDVTGVVDLEPYTFHAGRQNMLFTAHLKTFWGNVSKETRYGITEDVRALAIKIVNSLP